MPDLPLVSIITPSYNQGQFLEATLRSVLEQDYPHLEYIVIDGGSQDGSPEIIRRYAGRLAYWESQPDRGQSHAINKGLQRASGEILGWLNSDDLLLPGTLQTVVETFLAEPAVDVIYGRLERIDAAGSLLPTPELPKDRVEFGLPLLIGECVVNQPGCFWRREAMLRAGWLDESLRYSMDYEYWMRLALSGVRFRRLSQPVARFRLSGASKTVAQSAGQAREQLAVLDRLLALPDLPAQMGISPQQARRQARRTQAVFCLQAFYGYSKQRDLRQAGHWLAQALRYDPSALLQRRWLDLALAGLRRRL